MNMLKQTSLNFKTLYDSIAKRSLTEEENNKVLQLTFRRLDVNDVNKFICALDPEDSKDFYNCKYPEIYRNIWRLKDVLLKALYEEDVNIQHKLEDIDPNFENIGDNPLKK